MGTNTMYVHRMGHVTTCTCTYVQSKEDLQRTSQMGTPHAWRVEYSFIYTVCARA